MIVEQFPDRTILVKGVEYLYFGGTNYLGMSTNPDFQSVLFNSIKKWGTSYGSSRNSNIKLSVYEKAEKLLAKNTGSEAALSVSSGMLAGKLIIEHFINTADGLFHFQFAHPAITNSNSLPILINEQLNTVIFEKKFSEITVTTDAIPNKNVKPIDLAILLEIPIEIKINLVIDESHSIGIISSEWQNYLKKENINIVKVASLGKAFGLSGGVISGSSDLISKIRNQESFIGASGMNPAFIETYCNAQDIFRFQKGKLETNLYYIETHFKNRKSFIFNPNYPNIYFDDQSIKEKLLENKILTTSFKYTNSSANLNRIVINANHTVSDLDLLLSVLNSD
jgi:8-amino-7-oxononanoate synthase